MDWTLVDKMAREHEPIRIPEPVKEPLIIEYISTLDSCQYRCICNYNAIEQGDDYCARCGRKLFWQKKIIDPRTETICAFCGKDNIERPSMVTGGGSYICSDCIVVAYNIIHVEKAQRQGTIDINE